MQVFRGSIAKAIGDVLACVVVTCIIAFVIYLFTENMMIVGIAGAVIFILSLLLFVSGDLETLTIDNNYVKLYTMTGKLEWEVDRSKAVFTFTGYRGLRAEGEGINQPIHLNSFSTKDTRAIYDALGAQEIIHKLN